MSGTKIRMSTRTSQTFLRKRLVLRSHILLWGASIVGLILLLVFGEPGLIACLVLYSAAMALVFKMFIDAYRIPQGNARGLRISIDPYLLFTMDAAAASNVMLGIVTEVAARDYGDFYRICGSILFAGAVALWAIALGWVVVNYRRIEKSINLIIFLVAFTYLWLVLINAINIYFGMLAAYPLKRQ